MSDIIDINVYETTEEVTINVTPNVIEVNINKITASGSVTSVNGQTGDVTIAVSDNNFTNALKTKLDGIASGAEVNVNADWNATSGDAQILNKPTIPAAQIQSDWNQTNDVSLDYIKNKPTIGSGDMLKSTYDVDNTGVVDNAEAISIIGRNATGSTLRKGTIIYISGSTGNRPNFIKAQANGESTSAGTFGVIKEDIANNTDGYCTTLGYLDNLDTRTTATYPFTSDTLADGDTIYLSPTTAGYITNIKPSAPNHLVYIGKVTRTSPTNGTIVYRIQNGYELNEIHDVAISSVADKQLLSYDSATSLWKNKSVTTADISDSTNKRYQTDNQNSFNDATSSIQTQLDSKQDALSYTPYKFVQTSQTAHTGTTSETIVATETIVGGVYNANDSMKALFKATKGITSGAVQMRLRINTTNSLSGSTQIGLLSLTATNTYGKLNRTFDLNGGNLYGYNFNSSLATDNTAVNTAGNSTTYNTANTLYFFWTLQLFASIDSATPNLANLTN